MSPLASPPAAGPRALPLAVSMFLISFATVLFTLAIWKLLSFFIMPSLFFDLLFVGFPLGAFIGVRAFRINLPSFSRSVAILQGAMVLSIAACLACKHFDYLRAHLFEVQLVKLLGQMGIFTAFFIPFFCAYGLSEYLGYQLGTIRFGGRMRLVYGIYLLGAAGAYLFLHEALRPLRLTGVVTLAFLLVALASLLLARRPWARGLFLLESAGLAAVLLIPSARGALDQRFLRLYKGEGGQSSARYIEAGFDIAYQVWGRYSLTEVLHHRQTDQYAGLYNDLMQWEYSPDAGFDSRMIGAVPIEFLPRGSRICLIGAGGGRQIRWALQPRYSFSRILALEVEPAVIEAVTGPLRAGFRGVYDAGQRSPVEVVVTEARSFMERSSEEFDLIYLPSVGGYPQMMLEPGNMVRTKDAYATLARRLSPHGVLAIWYPRGLDLNGVLTEQYVRTLSGPGLELRTEAFANNDEYLILAARGTETRVPTLGEIQAFLSSTDPGLPLPPRTDPQARTRRVVVPDDPHFRPITDDKPFLAGNMRHIFSTQDLYALFGIVGGSLFLVAAGLLLGLRRAGDPEIPGRSYLQVAALSFLIGANFVVLEHALILALFKKMYYFSDALTLGAISFLVLSGLGSIVVAPRGRAPCQAVAAVILCVTLAFQASLPPVGIILALGPVALAVGTFFPGLFEAAARNPLAVFALDAVGAACGSAVAFFIPIAFGFTAFFPMVGIIFVTTTVAAGLFARGLPRAAPPPGSGPAPAAPAAPKVALNPARPS